MFYTTREVADHNRISRTTVTSWCNQGILPAFKVGDGQRSDWRLLALVLNPQEDEIMPDNRLQTGEILTVCETADVLRISENQVRTLIKQKELPAFRPYSGSRTPYRVRAEDLRAYIGKRLALV